MADNKKRALCVMCVGGEKYQRQFEIVKPQMKKYANKCNADFVVIDNWLDENRQRDAYSQKMLIPDHLRQYDLVLFMDLDIIISLDCPDIFEQIPDDCGLAAVVNPRGTDKFKKMYAGNKRILNETVHDYFTSRGFEANENLVGNINGGVLVFRPALVADAFKEYYESTHSQGNHTAYEEAPMAYYAQTHNMFYELDARFNTMLPFEAARPEYENIYDIHHNGKYLKINKLLKKFFHKNHMLLRAKHTKFINDLLDEGMYIIHMSGGFYDEAVIKKVLQGLR